MIALLEGRGVSREVGIAALDKDTGKVMLVQVITLIDHQLEVIAHILTNPRSPIVKHM